MLFMGPNSTSFSSFSQYNDKYLNMNGKSVGGVPGIRTRSHKMVGADESTELRPPAKIEMLRQYN